MIKERNKENTKEKGENFRKTSFFFVWEKRRWLSSSLVVEKKLLDTDVRRG